MKKLILSLVLSLILVGSGMAAPLDSEQDPGGGGGGGGSGEVGDPADGLAGKAPAPADKAEASGGGNFVPSNNATSILSQIWQIVLGAHQADLK